MHGWINLLCFLCIDEQFNSTLDALMNNLTLRHCALMDTFNSVFYIDG